MEQKQRASASSRSRGVSTSCSDGAGLGAGGLLAPDRLLGTAEQSDHVGTSREDTAAGSHEAHGRMKDVHLGRFLGVSAGSSFGAIPEEHSRISTSLIGQHMADDEHILYGVKALSHTEPFVGKWPPSHQRLQLDSTTVSPSRPLVSLVSAAVSTPSLTTPSDHLSGIAIPSRVANGTRSFGANDTKVLDGNYRVGCSPEDRACPSSYPPTSPLLPPPPPTSYGAVDPALVMFPGPARDGGIRIVPVHGHGEDSRSGVHGAVTSGSVNPEASWARHTRVYGGGVCLACAAATTAAAAAAGEGGFYGDSVRPEDKRS